MVEEDAVADNRMLSQRADIVHPLDRRLAMAADHLLKLRDRLGGVGLPGKVSPGRIIIGFAQQFCRTGIDLGGANHPHQPARRMLVNEIDVTQIDMALVPRIPGNHPGGVTDDGGLHDRFPSK